jgi:hypothetical protein
MLLRFTKGSNDLSTRVIRICEDSNGESWYHTTQQIHVMLQLVFKNYLVLISEG